MIYKLMFLLKTMCFQLGITSDYILGLRHTTWACFNRGWVW